MPEPDLRDLSLKKVITRWQALGQPKLEHPSSGTPITDLESLSAQADLMPNRLAYLAQQLWPSLAETLVNISNRPRNWRPFTQPGTTWGQELMAQRGVAIRALIGLGVLGLIVWWILH